VCAVWALLIASLLFCRAIRAEPVEVIYGCGERLPYSDARYWSPQVVPNNGNGGNSYRVTIACQGPTLDIDATVDALTLQNGLLYVVNHSFASAETRNETSAFALELAGGGYVIGEGVQVGAHQAPARADLGSLANYNAATQTLEGGVYAVTTGFARHPATLSFTGAKIVINSAGIRVSGEEARITNEVGQDALQPLAVNNGILDLRKPFETAGDFTNNGELVVYSENLVVPTWFTVTGKLTNFDPNTKTLTGGKYVVRDGSGGAPQSVKFQFRGADIVTNSAALWVGASNGGPTIVDEQGADALRNLANNSATGSLILSYSFNANGPRFANAGFISIGTFKLPSGGVFEQSDGELSISFVGSGKLDTQGGSILLQGGRVTGGGTLAGTTSSNAVISPGNNDRTPLMTFAGNLTLRSSSILRFDIAGTARGPGVPSRPTSPQAYGYDAIDGTGSVAIDGQLQVALSSATQSGGRFTPASSDTFILLKAQAPIAGSFKNIANGGRLTTTDGGGSFLVNYGPNTPFDPTTVVLSDFQPNTSAGVFLNMSTRVQVEGGDDVLIGGFIVTGSEPKPVIMRAVGPSLRSSGISGPLDDPILTLHDNTGATMASNDNWQQSQRIAIQATGVAPTDQREPAIVRTLEPGAYTLVVEGKNGANGVCVVEIYDLNAGTQSQLANISTRGVVQGGSGVMIGGVIIGGGTSSTDILVRALGPSLTKAGVAGAMEDPLFVVYNGYGVIVANNDDWKQNRAVVEPTGMGPDDDREAADVRTLQPGAYTAVVSPARGKSGVGLVEFYRLR